MEEEHHPMLYMQDPLALLATFDHTMARKSSSNPATSSAARQSRRRTSPQDQLILEEAFRQNPKPEKASRTELSQRVSMGEKEIAIWFQNKRQVLRRRSGPVTGMSGEEFSSAPQSSQSSTDSPSDSFQSCSQEVHEVDGSSTPTTSQSTSNSDNIAIPTQQEDGNSSSQEDKMPGCASSEQHDESHMSQLKRTPSNIESTQSDLQSATDPSTLQYGPSSMKSKPVKPLSRLQNTSFELYDDSVQDASTTSTSLPAIPRLVATLKRTQSQPRLCTSLNGSVRVKTGISPSPSPPRRPPLPPNGRQVRQTGLQRSQSAVVHPTFDDIRARASIGRSRDSRTWEFYCDAASRNELTKAAELEQTGSAAGAIALMRSGSRTTLPADSVKSNPNKRISNPASSKPGPQKRLKAEDGKNKSKPKLGRTSSSAARLQSNSNVLNATKTAAAHSKATRIVDTEQSSKKQKGVFDIYDEGNESDKENWLPGTQTLPTPRRRRQHDNFRRPDVAASVLRESSYLSFSAQSRALTPRRNAGGHHHGNRLGSKYGQENGGSDEDDDEDDGEVARFMGGGGDGSGNGDLVAGEGEGDEDLAGVHGLLSLSQGAWR